MPASRSSTPSFAQVTPNHSTPAFCSAFEIGTAPKPYAFDFTTARIFGFGPT